MTLTLTDGTAFNNTVIKHVDTFIYYRKYTSTQWFTTVLPVALNYSDWGNKFEIAEIKDISIQLNADGNLESFKVIKTVIKNGSIIPNKPYLIRAKTASTTAQTIKKTNCDVYPSTPEELIIVKDSFKFIFKGTYTKLDANEMLCKYYSTKETWQQSNGATTVGPFRVVLNIIKTPEEISESTTQEEISINNSQIEDKLTNLEQRLKKLETAIGDLIFKVE